MDNIVSFSSTEGDRLKSMKTSCICCLKSSGNFLLATVAIAAVVGFSSPTLAFELNGFTGIFHPDNFTLTNDNADGSVNPTDAQSGTIVLTGGNNNFNTSGTTTWKTTTAITQKATVSFAWTFNGENSAYNGTVGDRGGYIINTNPTYNLGSKNGDHGSVASLVVMAGQTFGFIVQTANNTGGPGVLTITDFSFDPEPIPEPLTILGTGVVLGALPILKKEYAKKSKKQDKDA